MQTRQRSGCQRPAWVWDLRLQRQSSANALPTASQTKANQRSATPGRETNRLALFGTQDLQVDRRALDYRDRGTHTKLRDHTLWFLCVAGRLRFLGVEEGCPLTVQVLEEPIPGPIPASGMAWGKPL